MSKVRKVSNKVKPCEVRYCTKPDDRVQRLRKCTDQLQKLQTFSTESLDEESLSKLLINIQAIINKLGIFENCKKDINHSTKGILGSYKKVLEENQVEGYENVTINTEDFLINLDSASMIEKLCLTMVESNRVAHYIIDIPSHAFYRSIIDTLYDIKNHCINEISKLRAEGNANVLVEIDVDTSKENKKREQAQVMRVALPDYFIPFCVHTKNSVSDPDIIGKCKDSVPIIDTRGIVPFKIDKGKQELFRWIAKNQQGTAHHEYYKWYDEISKQFEILNYKKIGELDQEIDSGATNAEHPVIERVRMKKNNIAEREAYMLSLDKYFNGAITRNTCIYTRLLNKKTPSISIIDSRNKIKKILTNKEIILDDVELDKIMLYLCLTEGITKANLIRVHPNAELGVLDNAMKDSKYVIGYLNQLDENIPSKKGHFKLDFLKYIEKRKNEDLEQENIADSLREENVSLKQPPAEEFVTMCQPQLEEAAELAQESETQLENEDSSSNAENNTVQEESSMESDKNKKMQLLIEILETIKNLKKYDIKNRDIQDVLELYKSLYNTLFYAYENATGALRYISAKIPLCSEQSKTSTTSKEILKLRGKPKLIREPMLDSKLTIKVRDEINPVAQTIVEIIKLMEECDIYTIKNKELEARLMLDRKISEKLNHVVGQVTSAANYAASTLLLSKDEEAVIKACELMDLRDQISK